MDSHNMPFAMNEVDEKALEACGLLFQRHGLKLLCAESMTAGYLSTLWSLELHSGDYFLGSAVCYDEQYKVQLLGVPKQKIEKYTAESAVVTLRLLDGLRQAAMPAADVLISVTGLAFQTKNPKQKRPIGTVYYAFAYKGEKRLFKRHFSGNASAILIQTCNSIFNDMLEWLPSKLGEE